MTRQGTGGTGARARRAAWGVLLALGVGGGSAITEPASELGAVDPENGRRSAARAALGRAGEMQAAGRYSSAAEEGERALRLLEAGARVEPLELARARILVGELQRLAGNLARAKPLLTSGLAAEEMALGAADPEVAATRTKLATVLQAEGLYDRAEPLYRRALTAQRAILGEDHADLALTLNGLATLYLGQGVYEQAEAHATRALGIQERALGMHHPAIALTLGILARVSEAKRDPGGADRLIRRALDLQRRALGGAHPDVASSLVCLAAAREARGRYDLAEPEARRALEIRQAALGPDHLLTAASLADLARISLALGKLEEAERFGAGALSVRRAILGEDHPDLAPSLQVLARTRLARGQIDDALPLLEQSLLLSEARLRREALDFPEARLETFLRFLRSDEELMYGLLRAHPEDVRVRRLALTLALLRKGRSVGETANTSRMVYRGLDLPDRDALERLQGVRAQLARLILEGPGSLSPVEHQRLVSALEARANELEARLARRSKYLRELNAVPASGEILERVAAALPDDGALVEIVAYAEGPIASPPGAGHQAPGQLRYLALVLSPGGRIDSVDLGTAAALDGPALRLRDALAARNQRFQALAEEVHALVFAPLRPALGSARRVFISPDGQLALVPFAALHDGHRFVADSFEITYLTSGKDVLRRFERAAPARSVVVLADPDFTAPEGSEAAARPWLPLPGTLLEAKAIQHLFPGVQPITGRDATRDRLLRVASPGILHIATHGFFGDDEAAAGDSRGLGKDSGTVQLPRAANPLVRSGLVLAAAPSADASAQAHHGNLVTALELAGLDLWGTQLVVLSACDTGRGDTSVGQGVYGLRRAFVAAGAETVVMSLWNVNDETTHALMADYYRNLLAGQGRTAALQSAMQALRATHPHPYFWAPFISLGRDAPLRLDPSGEDEPRPELYAGGR